MNCQKEDLDTCILYILISIILYLFTKNSYYRNKCISLMKEISMLKDDINNIILEHKNKLNYNSIFF